MKVSARIFIAALLLIAFAACFFPLSQAQAQSDLEIEYVASDLWANMYDVAIDGNYAYCVLTYGLLIVDISTPASPSFVSKFYTSGDSEGVTVAGNYAYLADAEEESWKRSGGGGNRG